MDLSINEIIKLFNDIEVKVDLIQKFCKIAGINDWEKFKKSKLSKKFYSKKLNCYIKVVGNKSKDFGWKCSEIEHVLKNKKCIKKINTVKEMFEGIVVTPH